MKKEQKQIDIDGFEIEEIVREAFDIEDDKPTPEILNIEYNQLIDFTKFIITITLESATKKLKEEFKKNNHIWD